MDRVAVDILKDYAASGVITLLVAVIGVLFAKRASNKVENDNAHANRASRFEDNLQKRYEESMARNSELRDEIDLLKKQLAAANNRLAVVQMVADADPKRAIEIAGDSAFVDISRPLQPRKAKPPAPSSPSDPFQAADPYAPLKPRKK